MEKEYAFLEFFLNYFGEYCLTVWFFLRKKATVIVNSFIKIC